MRFLLALLSLIAVAYAQPTAPVITGVTPAAVDAGGPPFTITVSVSAFVPGGVVRWSGTALDTQYVNDTTLSATVPTGLIAICGKYLVTVTSQQVSNASNSIPVIVKPVLNAISPSTLPAGANGTGVTAIGLGFSSNVYLTLLASGNRTNLATGHNPQGSTTNLTASVPASALDGTFPKAELYVTDPSTNAVSQTLPITLTYAQVNSITPNQINSGIDTFVLMVQGANFVPGAVVLFNGAPLTTQYDSASRLFALVPAALVHDEVPGGVGIQVKNPGTAATNSIKLVIGGNPFGTQLISLSPDHSAAGGPALTVTVTGERFTSNSIVTWVRTPLPTVFVSSTQLTFTIPATLLKDPAVASIKVVTPGLTDSNLKDFPVVVVSPTISVLGDGITPTTAVAGSPAFVLTVNGDGFIPTSQLIGFTGATTTYVSLIQLKVNVPASAIAVPGKYPVRVQNPPATPDGPPILSPQAPVFTVTAPGPAITELSPASVLVGSPAFTLTVTGRNFVPTATVNWNGQPLVTRSVSTTQLTAQIPASLIAAAGTAKIMVVNDASAASNELPLQVSSSLAPTLTGLNPSSTTPGVAVTLVINGLGLTVNTTVQWNGQTLDRSSVTFVNAGQLTVRVPASLVAAVGTANVSVTTENGASAPLVFSIVAAPPVTSIAGAVNAASFLPSIAPGALISIFGKDLSASEASADKTPLPTSLGGSSVTINDVSAPLVYVSPTQINAQVPYETKPGTAKLVVKLGSVATGPVDVPVTATGPGVFTQLPGTHVLALNLSDGTLNTPQTPASPGQYVTAYLTGQGAVNPPAPTGDVAPSDPLSFPVAQPVQVKIGGKAATLQFAGLAPGFVGLMQMNILIPDVPAGELPLEVSIGGVSAATTTISIR